MTKTAIAILRREERIQRRRNQIIDAARICVRDDGFHAASISRIAATAAMSAGHIYKYFENKEAIITALIEHHMDEFTLLITQVDQSENRSIDSLVESFVAKLPSILEGDRTALWLEIQAEAGRNPKVKEMATRSARRFLETIRKIIKSVLDGDTEQELDERAEMLLICMHGLGIQASVLSGGAEHLATAIRFVFQTVLSASLHPVVSNNVKAA
ncbi:TetR/AcrR family transcriptional regulator [Sphingobium sp. AN558]|uniref:TetR/AcrR family transcriptional regulator n=1 Tax=Sphingobium sp. AN558 TaxID=3133442 RepID=UPI0030C1AFB8